ncbi:hypothetical protein C0214_10915 [Methylobacterium sp. DM1]|jgi:hypothetical protein|uniref:Uncharacterized protein n=1 Tax=Methylorubrum populi (strain ATCC BAA-705 / NCIMB 13946 / BJ001) TaxID=441620 RepID=B1ZJB7_METPB|nr:MULTISPECIES: hypothetical protein [Methylorubrum]ACB80022.1 conserved hypothetical protein [Methylorubrum populi BJ001]AWI88717.1 hypothetical protein C0214_10915 [Methylobacterium sp. DM1]MBI1691946.1 hypothetical protein [Methylorubrum sp. DB1722]
MARKRLVYFHQDIELTGVANVRLTEIAASQDGRFETLEEALNLSAPRARAGKAKRSDFAWLPVTRHVRVVDTSAPHVCDFRCQGATPGGECRCECRGRNHGLRYAPRNAA